MSVFECSCLYEEAREDLLELELQVVHGYWELTQVLCGVEENLSAAPPLQPCKLSFKWVLRVAVLGLSTSCWYESEPPINRHFLCLGLL